MDASRQLNGRVAIVTGAAQGIGRASALRLAEVGAHVVVADLAPESADKVAEEIRSAGGSANSRRVDVAMHGDVQELFAITAKERGRVDVLVNNAGVLRTSKLDQITDAEWDLVVNVNLKGVFLCSQAAALLMKPVKSGRIVNIASMAGKATSTLGGAHYTAAKAGVLGLSRHLARELAPYLINVNAVCPGIVETPMVDKNVHGDQRTKVLASIPFGRFAEPREIADLVLFLASDDAAYITGAAIDIHGGEMIIQ